MAKYRKCLPSGKNAGQRCEVYTDASSLVSGAGKPPLALICSNGAIGEGENTITPLELHAPPRPSWASQSACAVVAFNSIIFIFPPAKNPSECPSGDQNGKMASMVSGNR